MSLVCWIGIEHEAYSEKVPSSYLKTKPFGMRGLSARRIPYLTDHIDHQTEERKTRRRGIAQKSRTFQRLRSRSVAYLPDTTDAGRETYYGAFVYGCVDIDVDVRGICPFWSGAERWPNVSESSISPSHSGLCPYVISCLRPDTVPNSSSLDGHGGHRTPMKR